MRSEGKNKVDNFSLEGHRRSLDCNDVGKPAEDPVVLKLL